MLKVKFITDAKKPTYGDGYIDLYSPLTLNIPPNTVRMLDLGTCDRPLLLVEDGKIIPPGKPISVALRSSEDTLLIDEGQRIARVVILSHANFGMAETIVIE
jgi:hypothetical protein